MVLLIALLLAGFGNAATASGADPSDEVDLASVMVTSGDISPDAVQLLDSELAAEDYLADVPGTLKDQVTAHYRQGWGRTFEVGEAHLGIILTEYHYNDYVHSDLPKSTLEPPDGALADSRWELENNSVVHATAPASRIKVEVFARLADGVRQGTLDELRALANSVLTTQADAVPPLSDLPKPEEALAIGRQYHQNWIKGGVALIFLTALLGSAAATLRDRGSREWLRHLAKNPTEPPSAVDLTPHLRRENRRRSILTILRLFAAAAIFVALWSIKSIPSTSLLLMLLGALALFNALYMIRRWRGEQRKGRPDLGVRIKALHLAGATFSLALVVVGLGALTASAALFFMVENVTLRIMAVTYAFIGLAAISASRGPSRFFRRLAQPAVRRAIDNDPRPRVLLLRSFQDDDLEVRGRTSFDSNIAESIAPEAYILFEEILATRLWNLGPVLAIGQPGTKLQPLGAARDYYSDDDWQDAVERVAAEAVLLAVVVGRSPGLMWEIDNLRRRHQLARTAFILPPVPVKELQVRLRFLASALEVSIDAFDPGDYRYPLVIRFDDSGEPILYTAAGRDDRAYEAAIDRLVADLSEEPQPLSRVASHWYRKADDVDDLLATYDPGKRRRRRKSVGGIVADLLIART